MRPSLPKELVEGRDGSRTDPARRSDCGDPLVGGRMTPVREIGPIGVKLDDTPAPNE